MEIKRKVLLHSINWELMCVSVCVCLYIFLCVFIYFYVCVFIYFCVCVCIFLCVCVTGFGKRDLIAQKLN